jgi:uncharacterized protein (TIGR00369 family)
MKFESYGNCFVCGKNNPGGLRLRFEISREERTLKTTFVASPVFQGYDGVVHGGIVSTLLDEAMSKLAYELGYHAVTGTLDIRFKNPAPVGQPLLVHGEIIEVRNRAIKARARVEKEDGTLLATATSLLIRQRGSRAGTP